MKNNCQNCYYRSYKISQKPCVDCEKFNKFMRDPKSEVEFQITFFGVVVLIISTVVLGISVIALFNLFK